MRGAELRKLREGLGWTQTQLAAKIGVAANTVARWERNEIPINPGAASEIKRRFVMTKTVTVKTKDAKQPLIFEGITDAHATTHRLTLRGADRQIVAEFDKNDISSWYETPAHSEVV